MRELSAMEVQEVSGASLFSRMGAAFLGAVAGAGNGVIKYGVAGGSTGGLLGVGVISALVGAVVGLVQGTVQGAIYGLVADWQRTQEVFIKTTEELLGLVNPFPKV